MAVALARGHEVAAAVYAGVLAVDVVASLTLGRRYGSWWGMGRRGNRWIFLSWGAVAVCHLAVAIVFYLGPDEIGAYLVLVAGLPAFLAAGTAHAHLRYWRLIPATLGPGERLLDICTGQSGQPPIYTVLAITDRRVIGFTQTSMYRAQLDQFDSVERAELVDVALIRDDDEARVVARTAERELSVSGPALAMAESFVRAAGPGR